MCKDHDIITNKR